ncbi:MAG: FAD-dependent monooxygenase [Gammaproteobacteria bacterium]
MSAMLIVGGGPVGASLALAAENAILLSAPPPPSGGRYYALNAASADFLTNAAGMPLPENTPVRQFLLCAGFGRRRYLTADGDSPLCRIVGEEKLSEWLRRALRRKGAEMYDAAPVSLCADAAAAGAGVRARLPDGRELSAPLLAVADGARSAAARMRNVGAAVSFFGQRALTARVSVAGLADDVAAQWFANRDVLALLPAGGGIFALVWSLPEERARELAAGGADALAAAASDRAGFAIAAADDSAPRGFVLAASRRAARAARRTAFVGDSARTIHPLAGQGLNAGLADCALLLRCLRRRGGDADNALADYALGGRRGATLHGITAFLNRFGGLASPLFAVASRPPFCRWAARAANY